MYSVNFWGSHPGLENDDCWTGRDFGTMAEAVEFYNNPWTDAQFTQYFAKSTAYIELDGGDYRLRKNPLHKPSKRDNSWRREIANEEGMLGGCDAYNEVMGY